MDQVISPVIGLIREAAALLSDALNEERYQQTHE